MGESFTVYLEDWEGYEEEKPGFNTEEEAKDYANKAMDSNGFRRALITKARDEFGEEEIIWSSDEPIVAEDIDEVEEKEIIDKPYNDGLSLGDPVVIRGLAENSPWEGLTGYVVWIDEEDFGDDFQTITVRVNFPTENGVKEINQNFDRRNVFKTNNGEEAPAEESLEEGKRSKCNYIIWDLKKNNAIYEDEAETYLANWSTKEAAIKDAREEYGLEHFEILEHDNSDDWADEFSYRKVFSTETNESLEEAKKASELNDEEYNEIDEIAQALLGKGDSVSISDFRTQNGVINSLEDSELKIALRNLGYNENNFKFLHSDEETTNEKLELDEGWLVVDPYDDEETKVAKEAAKKCKLSKGDYEQLLDDIYNLRGNEWLEEIKKSKDKDLIKKFRKVAQIEEELEEDKDDNGPYQVQFVDEDDEIYDGGTFDSFEEAKEAAKDGYYSEYVGFVIYDNEGKIIFDESGLSESLKEDKNEEENKEVEKVEGTEVVNDEKIDEIKDEIKPTDVIPAEEQAALATGKVIYDEEGNVIGDANGEFEKTPEPGELKGDADFAETEAETEVEEPAPVEEPEAEEAPVEETPVEEPQVEEQPAEEEHSLEIPVETYTEVEDIKRINGELSQKIKENKIFAIRKEKDEETGEDTLMFAEPEINGIWLVVLRDGKYIKKIVLF